MAFTNLNFYQLLSMTKKCSVLFHQINNKQYEIDFPSESCTGSATATTMKCIDSNCSLRDESVLHSTPNRYIAWSPSSHMTTISCWIYTSRMDFNRNGGHCNDDSFSSVASTSLLREIQTIPFLKSSRILYNGIHSSVI